MERKRKEILFSVLTFVGTAAVFFLIGYTTAFYHGPTHTVTTEIEYVEPSKTDETESTSDNSLNSEKIDLNTATKEQLMTVPGIGETYALRILEYREEVGGFWNINQLREVKGVGDKRYAQWAPYFTISQINQMVE